jgi:hypothetical protein
LFLALALFFSQFGTSLGDSQVHGSQNDPRFEGLVLENKGKVVSPNGGQNSPEQRKRGTSSRGTTSSGLGKKRLQTYSAVQTLSSTYLDSALPDSNFLGQLKRRRRLVSKWT